MRQTATVPSLSLAEPRLRPRSPKSWGVAAHRGYLTNSQLSLKSVRIWGLSQISQSASGTKRARQTLIPHSSPLERLLSLQSGQKQNQKPHFPESHGQRSWFLQAEAATRDLDAGSEKPTTEATRRPHLFSSRVTVKALGHPRQNWWF